MAVKADEGNIFIDQKLLASNRINRLRFTLAHELAHWMIHQEHYVDLDGIACKTSTNAIKSIESEADYLAAALLMPQGRVRVAFKRIQGQLIHPAIVEQLANVFQVSTQAMAIRLRDLNLKGRRYEDVSKEKVSRSLRCPHCNSKVCEISSVEKPFTAEASSLDLKIVCTRCGEEVSIMLENT